MKSLILRAAACAMIAATGACATLEPVAEVVAAAGVSESAKLKTLLEASESAELERNPITAFYRGNFANAHRLTDYSPAYFAAERAAAEANIAALALIDRGELGGLDQIAYDTFEYANRRTLEATSPQVLPTILALPLDHFTGLHADYPGFSATDGMMPFKTQQDYANNVSRHADFARIVDASIARFRDGVAQGITLPRLTVEMMIKQLDTQLGAPVEEDAYYAPLRTFPADFTEAQKEEARAALTASHDNVLFPALRKLRAYLADEYLAQARDTIAASAPPGGDAYYKYRVAEMTTLPLTAEEIHQTGLSEVARISKAIAQTKEELGGRTAQTYTDKEALTKAWYEIGEKVDPLLDQLFLRKPNAPLEIKPYEPYREQFFLAASYQPGEADGSRPGTFYFSGWNLPERKLYPTIRLYLHEGNPGHHFQVMFARENQELPAILRESWFTSYGEGWALYAEYLGYELGIYDDPLARLHALETGEMHRAVRLVVDTGMHALGWSREKAIDFMVQNGSARDYAANETARYIAMPAQALGYKIGELKIKQLRARAETALGDRFDVRRFHDEVLNSGNIPLPVLEAKIDAWIARGGV